MCNVKWVAYRDKSAVSFSSLVTFPRQHCTDTHVLKVAELHIKKRLFKFKPMWTSIHDFPSGQLNSGEHYNNASE